MAVNEKKDFDKEAAAWDNNPVRVKLAQDVADAIVAEARPDTTMDALDFGCGTGLVTLRLQPRVRTIVGADSSSGMLGVLAAKVTQQGLTNVRTQLVNLEHGGRVQGSFHLIVSSMTLHHIPDTEALLRELHGLLQPGGLLCLADLDTEDGSFHGDNTGVFHHGFDRHRLKGFLADTGFTGVRDSTAATVVRPRETGNVRFPVFLVSGQKR